MFAENRVNASCSCDMISVVGKTLNFEKYFLRMAVREMKLSSSYLYS